MYKHRFWVTAFVIAACSTLSSAGFAQEETKDVFNALAVNMGGGPTGASTNLQITVTKWSSEGQRNALLGILKEKGHKDFLGALHEMGQAGHARALGVAAGRANPFPSTPFQAAYQFVRGDEREVVMVAERPISASEARSASMSLDYDTTVIIMKFPAGDENANGTGLLYRALKIQYDTENEKLAVEQMGREPVRLTQITKVE